MIPDSPGACATCSRWSWGPRGRGDCTKREDPAVRAWASKNVYADDGCWHGPIQTPETPCPAWEGENP